LNPLYDSSYRNRRPPVTKAQLRAYIEKNQKAYFDANHPEHAAVVRTALQLAKGPAAQVDAEERRIHGSIGEDHIAIGAPRGGAPDE
jgi:hypothetical protein